MLRNKLIARDNTRAISLFRKSHLQVGAGRQDPHDTPEGVAAKILEAVETKAAETYTASTKP